MIVDGFESAFGARLDDFVIKLGWDEEHSLWAMAGKQYLFKLDSNRKKHLIAEDTCKWFSLDKGHVAYVTASNKIVVRTVSNLEKVAEVQFDVEIHSICLQGDSIVIASDDGLSAWDFTQSSHHVVHHRVIIAMDMCYFAKPDQVVIAAWDLVIANTMSGNLRVLESREYDVEYPFYAVTTFEDKRLCVSSSCLQLFDTDFKCIASSSSIRAVDAVFLDEYTLLVREGGDQEQSARRKETTLKPSTPSGKNYRVIIAANSGAFAFDSKTRSLAIAGQGQLSIMQASK